MLDLLQAALSAGPRPDLDALTSCTGCRQCGHEGGRKSRIKAHTKANPCAQCQEMYGLAEGCCAGASESCSCAFHSLADERLLNRVVGRACRTAGFLEACRCGEEEGKREGGWGIVGCKAWRLGYKR